VLIYIAGPYSGKNYVEIDTHIDAARDVAIKLWEMGHAVICPHQNTAHFEVDCSIDYEAYLKGDFNIISRVDAMVLLPGWTQSEGACREEAYAKSLGLPIYMWNDLPPVHPTEIRSPEQCKAFRETLGTMYRLHLDKNSDYSPSNISGPGADGLMTRIWDKATRLMNLTGFHVVTYANDLPSGFWQKFWRFVQGRVVVVDKIIYTEPKTPKHESIDDTLLDNAVYSIIFRLFRAGKWGH
jgi:hypothetical protein